MNTPTLKPRPGFRYRAGLALYAALLKFGEPLVWRYFAKRAKADPAYMEHPEERRGEGVAFDADLWVHAVSLGEFTSAEPLIREARSRGWRVVTTHATPAGRAAAEAAFAGDPEVSTCYMPIDRPAYWQRFFERCSPKAGLIMEVEFWPVMFEEARKSGCALCLANSQVPSKSFARARLLALLAGHPVARAAAVFAKSDPIAERFRALGAAPVSSLGETRFDIPPPEDLVTAGQALVGDHPVLTLASVVAGEEETYVELLREILQDATPPLVIWVPRAPERFEDHARLLIEAGFRVTRRTDAFEADLSQKQDLAETQILLGNSMREMFFYLAPADAVIVGGGFTEKGAHNVIEPLSLGKPVITGPHVWTIEYPAVEAEAAGVLKIVQDRANLTAVVRDAMNTGGPAAKAFHAANQGASVRVLDAIAPLMGNAP